MTEVVAICLVTTVTKSGQTVSYIGNKTIVLSENPSTEVHIELIKKKIL